MSRYPISNADPDEERRLTLLESLSDPGTLQRLSNLGVGSGWRCLEVGAGHGSIAKWLCEKVGTTGSVVATDIDTRFLDGIAADNLQVLKHDVVDDPLPSGGFDLIHSRAVLTHLGARDAVLDKMIRALRPGGWLLLEEVDGFPLTASGSEFFIKMMTPMVREWTWARKLPSLFAAHGLLDIGVDVRTALFNGGSPAAEFWRQRVEGTRDRWLQGGATDESVNELCRLLQDPSFWTFHSANISAWGRRPRSEASPS
jgi:SAM-dependent methyltransferase